jgi:hypothetical protein
VPSTEIENYEPPDESWGIVIGGSSADRLSHSPQSIRRGGANRTDVDPSPVQTNTGQFNYDHNPRQSLPPIEPGGAAPPAEAPKSGR